MKLSQALLDLREEVSASQRELVAKASSGLRSAVIQNIIDDESAHFNTLTSVTNYTHIPDTGDIPIENPVHWLQIPNVISCFVDMEGSTKLSAVIHPKSTAKTYRYFTNTAVRIFHEFDAPYIDVRGDGVFALFDSDKPYTALAATVSFKTFVSQEFSPGVKNLTKLDIGGHFGIDQHDVLVRKIGLKRYSGRSDRQNEVWAGKPVNMSSKLASKATGGKLWVSDRFYENIPAEQARNSCGCPSGESKPLWTKQDLSSDDRFDFNNAYSLNSDWCDKHGKKFCSDLVSLDEE